MQDLDIKDIINEQSLKHVAIIMDGNGRWAKSKGLNRTEGHKVGTERVIEITEACDKLGIKYLSLYAFSTENWKRPKNEIDTLFGLLDKFIKSQLNYLNSNNVKIRIMGDISSLPLINRKSIEYAINKTKNNTGLILNIGLNYGSRTEILNAFIKLYKDLNNDLINIDEIDENTILDYLYTKDIPDPDLMIRTSGEKRLSNFMLYQLAYTEFVFVDENWPDFSEQIFINTLKEFFSRKRRYGGVDE